MDTRSIILLYVLLVLAGSAAGQEIAANKSPEPTDTTPLPPLADPLIARIADRVDGARLIGDIEWLIGLGVRFTLDEHINLVGEELRARLAGFGLDAALYEFDFWGMPRFNVVATKTGTVYPDSVFVVCAHYDATSQDPWNFTPGADDNGSGVSAVLACAELLAPYHTRYSIQYVLFAGEEQGWVGSGEWVEDMAASGLPIVGGLNCDMIGWWTEGADFDLEVLTNAHSRWIADAVAQAAALYTDMPVEIHQAEDYLGSDFKSFWDHGYACVNHKEGFTRGDVDYNPYMHTTYDLPEYLSVEMLTGSVKVVVASLATLAGIDGWVADVAEEARPHARLQVYPNPFNARTTISCTAPDIDREVWLEIFDLRGRRVGRRSLPIRGGNGSVTWDARDRAGSPLPSGTYFLRADLGGEAVLGRIQLVE